MNLEEIRAAKQALEVEIKELLAPRLQAFAEKTGCPVDGLRVHMCWVTGMDRSVSASYISSVDLNIQTGL